MTPSIVSVHGVNTPPNVPNFGNCPDVPPAPSREEPLAFTVELPFDALIFFAVALGFEA